MNEENVTSLIRGAIQQVLRRRAHASLLVCQAPPSAAIHGIPRMIVSLTGALKGEYYVEGSIRHYNVDGQTILFCCKDGYMYKERGGTDEHLSFSFYSEHIRVTGFLRSAGVVVYHTNAPLGGAGCKVLELLDDMARSSYSGPAITTLLYSLLWLTFDGLDAGRPGSPPTSLWTWKRIDNYVREHANENLSRSELAHRFRLSEHYISHLYKMYSNDRFNAVQSRCRLERAAYLLTHSMLSLDEIAKECGFRYTSYFIRQFRKLYGQTPGLYRRSDHKQA